MSGLGYGDYRDRDVPGIMGTGVDAIQFPPPFPPLSTPHTLTPPQSTEPPAETPQATSSSVETFFGSVDRFGQFVVSVSRFGVVHCLAYPYVVFCRQCQVYPYNSIRPSLFAPLSTTAVLYHIAQIQGVQSLWRGWKINMQLMLAKPLIEAFLLKIAASDNILFAILASPILLISWIINPLAISFGIIRGSEDDTKTLSERSVPKRVMAYLFVKGLLQASVVLLASQSVSEMVQHTTGKVLNTESRFSFNRPFHTMDKYRRIPYLHLLPSSILHEIASDTLATLTSSITQRYQGQANDSLSVAMNSLWSSYISSFVSESLLYPLETVLVRLYCQGMPVLVDNVQTGRDVMFISTYYNGAVDCIKEIWGSEGVCGFYKGFSSLLLRYALHGALLVVLWRIVLFVKARYGREVRR